MPLLESIIICCCVSMDALVLTLHSSHQIHTPTHLFWTALVSVDQPSRKTLLLPFINPHLSYSPWWQCMNCWFGMKMVNLKLHQRSFSEFYVLVRFGCVTACHLMLDDPILPFYSIRISSLWTALLSLYDLGSCKKEKGQHWCSESLMICAFILAMALPWGFHPIWRKPKCQDHHGCAPATSNMNDRGGLMRFLFDLIPFFCCSHEPQMQNISLLMY